MNISQLKKFDVFDIILLVLFVVYIVFPVSTPQWFVPFLDSPIGMVVIFIVTVSLFVYRSPILGVLFIFVAYELIRRSIIAPNFMNTPSVQNAGAVSSQEEPVNHAPQQEFVYDHKPLEVVLPREPESPDSFAYKSLEEEIINVRAPVGQSDPMQMVTTSFLPVAHSVKNASMY